jgi:hypothetical protein
MLSASGSTTPPPRSRARARGFQGRQLRRRPARRFFTLVSKDTVVALDRDAKPRRLDPHPDPGNPALMSENDRARMLQLADDLTQKGAE